jgi:NitT/TauT family transport system substrate-binding protein
MLRKILLSLVALVTFGCEKAAAPGGSTRTTLQLNWKPEPQFGGFYTAQITGEFESRGLDVTIAPGGAGLPTVQMLGAGTVDFAIVSGDELLIARNNGIDLVALFAVYQTNPQGIMTPASRGLTSIDQVFTQPGTLAMERGLPYAQYLERKYGFDKLQVVPSPFGDLTQFRTRSDYAMQCFVTSEPLAAGRAGLAATTFLLADAGWNPYTTVLATRREVANQKPVLVQSMIDAVRAGWSAYLDDPTSTNEFMGQLNPTMDAATFSASAEAQAPLIRTSQVGAMTTERWASLLADLESLGLIKPGMKPADVVFAPAD